MAFFSQNLFPMLFDTGPTAVKLLARLLSDKSFTVKGELIEDSILTRLDSNGNFYSYEFIEEDDTFTLRTEYTVETTTGENLWEDYTSSLWSDLTSTFWGEVLGDILTRAISHEFIEDSALE